MKPEVPIWNVYTVLKIIKSKVLGVRTTTLKAVLRFYD